MEFKPAAPNSKWDKPVPTSRSPKTHQREYGSWIRENTYQGTDLTGLELDFLNDIAKKHKNYAQFAAIGISGFCVDTAWHDFPGRQEHKAFFIKLSDGTKKHFSYRKCIFGFKHSKDFNDALRREIKDQIDDFRTAAFAGKTKLTCPVSGDVVTPPDSHVDHIPPATFKNLVDEFLSYNSLDSDDISVTGREDDGYHLLSDRSIAKLWQDFHRANAKLRIVSDRGNAMAKKEAARLEKEAAKRIKSGEKPEENNGDQSQGLF